MPILRISIFKLRCRITKKYIKLINDMHKAAAEILNVIICIKSPFQSDFNIFWQNKQEKNQPKAERSVDKMEATKKNIQIVEAIIKIFNEQQCTVAEANDIMTFVKGQIYTTTTVKATINKELLV